MSRTVEAVALLLLSCVVSGCSGRGEPAGPTGPTPAAGPQTLTFNGTATLSATGGCSSPGHTISAGEGPVTVTLTQASAPRVAVQVCHPTAVKHALACSVPPFATVLLGAAVSAPLRGGRAQTATVFP